MKSWLVVLNLTAMSQCYSLGILGSDKGNCLYQAKVAIQSRKIVVVGQRKYIDPSCRFSSILQSVVFLLMLFLGDF